MSITLVIIIVTVLISYQAFQNQRVFDKLKHYPAIEASQNEYYRFITSGFVHGNWTHLLINMFVLYSFGGIVENSFVDLYGNFGRLIFLLMYVTAIGVADLHSFVVHKNNPSFSSIGASGAVSAVVFIFIILFPWEDLYIFPLVFLPIPAILMGIAYLIYSSWASKRKNDHINHSAHFYGALYGVLFVFITKPFLIEYFLNRLMERLPF